MKLKELTLLNNKSELKSLQPGKLLINTINAHSYNTALKDSLFADALINGDVLIPDGISIVMACRWLNAKSRPTERVAGWDLFEYEMKHLNTKGGKCFFMGSSEKVLALIRKRATEVYPNITVETYSPPYKPEFSDDENRSIVEAINNANPDLAISVHHNSSCCCSVQRTFISLQNNVSGFRERGRRCSRDGRRCVRAPRAFR